MATVLTTDEARTSNTPVGDDPVAEPPVPRSWWGISLALLGGLMGSGALADNSFLTHLATGRLILSDGVPHVDPYSFTAGGDPWVVSSWLASWSYGTAERVGGLGAIRILIALATALTVGFVWRTTAPARGVLVRVGLVALVVVLSGGWFSERPQIFAFAASAGMLVVMRERRSPLWMVPIGVVWVNVHASWPMGLVLLALWAGSVLVDDRRIDRHAVTCVLTFAAAVVVGALLSPYGYSLLTFPVEMLGRVDTLQFIKEWRRPSPSDPDLWIFVASVVAVSILAIRQRRLGTVVASVALVAPVALGVRNIPLATMILVTLGAPLLTGIGDERIGPVPSSRQMWVASCLGAMAIVGLVVATPDLDLEPYPVTILDELGESAPLGDHRLLSLDYVGNYLEFRDGADADVWNDDRAEVIPHEVFADYVTLLSEESRPGEWTDIVNRHQFDVIVWPFDDAFGQWILDGGGVNLVAERFGSVDDACGDGLEPTWSSHEADGNWVVAQRRCASVGF